MSPNVTHIQEFGNQLAILFDDGTKKLAYPTPNTGLWIVSGYDDSISFMWPFASSTWNMNNGHPEDNFRTVERPTHNGMDMGYGIANIEGTPVKAIADGVVFEVFNNTDGAGYGVGVTHGDTGYRSRYKHFFETPDVGIDDVVSQGQTLGGIGTTGDSTGNHLHFEIYEIGVDFVDPLIFMAEFNPSDLVVS